jgi:hypothetical protein
VKAFFGSMTGRVFTTLLLGILITAALTQLLADAERQRVLDEFRDLHSLDRAEQLIMATEIVPESARKAYLDIANRPGMRSRTSTPAGAGAGAHRIHPGAGGAHGQALRAAFAGRAPGSPARRRATSRSCSACCA